MFNNSEKSNITIVNQKLISILGAPIIFSPYISNHNSLRAIQKYVIQAIIQEICYTSYNFIDHRSLITQTQLYSSFAHFFKGALLFHAYFYQLLLIIKFWSREMPKKMRCSHTVFLVFYLGKLSQNFLVLRNFDIKSAQYQYLIFRIILLSKHKKLYYYISFLCFLCDQKSGLSYLSISTLSNVDFKKASINMNLF